MGNHVRIRRVKAINWGTKDSTKCFVFQLITGVVTSASPPVRFEVVNAGIQQCVAESPNTGGTGPLTAFHIGGREAGAVNAELYGCACFIRNCFVEGDSTNLTRDIRGLSMGWCKAGIIEGNQVNNVKIGGPHQDQATSREIVVRNNSYRNVIRGPYWNLGAKGDVRSVALSRTSGNTIAIGTLTNHGFETGDRVKIDVSGTGQVQAYEGVFIVERTGADTFQYPLESDPGSNVTGDAQKVYGVANILVERNIIELSADATTSKIAIHVHDGKTDSPPDGTVDIRDYVHTEAVIRENRVRYVDVKFDPNWSGEGIRVSGAKNVIVRDNIIELVPANPLKNFRCGTVKYFNNKTPSGALIQGLNGVSNQKYSELETESEDALLLTLI